LLDAMAAGSAAYSDIRRIAKWSKARLHIPPWRKGDLERMLEVLICNPSFAVKRQSASVNAFRTSINAANCGGD